MKRAVVISLLLISVAAGLVGLGTFAYFSDTASSTSNTFNSGTINVKVSNNALDPSPTWADNNSATWTMSNMKPGDIVDAKLWAKNTGSIDVVALLSKISLTGPLATCTPNVNCGLADKIDMLEYNDDTSVGSGHYFVFDYFMPVYDTGGIGTPGTPDGHLTLAEWSAGHSSDPSRAGYDTAWYCDGSGPSPGNQPCLLANEVPTNKSDPYFFLHIKWQLRPDAGNEVQGLTATYTMKLNGQQTWAPGMTGWPAENV